MSLRGEDRMERPEFWDRVEQLFHFALSLEPTERGAYLREAKAVEPDVVAEVESLIAEHEQAGSFLNEPAFRVALEDTNQQNMVVSPPLEDNSQSLIGKVIGHYRIERRIPGGGMGKLYLAHDTRLGGPVALKLLPPEYTKDEERLHRFKQEARSARALNHPSILTIYELGEEDGIHFIAAEYVEGTTLRARISGGPMPLKEAVDVALQVANALEAVHRLRIIHRDIKPENIMLRPDGIVKVLDFGIVKLTKNMSTSSESTTQLLVKTQQEMIIGTPRYMSPEQLQGSDVDTRTDIFSLGLVLYEIIAGHPPFDGDTREVITSILSKEPRPLAEYSSDVPAELGLIVTKALRKEREERYQTAGELARDLKSVVTKRYQSPGELAVDLTRLKGESSHLNPEPPDLMATKITENCIAEIRRQMLYARSLDELRMNLFRIEEFLSKQPRHAEARMLRNQIKEAMVVEEAHASTQRLSQQPTAIRASATLLSRFLTKLSVMILLAGVAWLMFSQTVRSIPPAGGHVDSKLFIAIIGICLLAIVAYRFVLKRWAWNPQIEPVNSQTHGGLRKVAFVGLAAAVIFLGSYALYLILTRPVVSTIHSLAVLPLVNSSSDPDSEYFSDGITESIINNLSNLSELRVLPRTTVFRYKGQTGDPQKVGRELGVDSVVTGKVGRRDDTLIFQAELVSVVDGSQLWGERYNRKPSDILALQEEIANRITENLRIKLTNEERHRLGKHPTDNPEAYQLYLKGRYWWNKRTSEGFMKGIDYFNEAISKDPEYALAYAGLADSYNLFGSYSELPPKEACPKARDAATKALELDDALAEAHTSLADIVASFYWDWPEAEKEFQIAIKFNPNYSAAHQWYSQYLARMGRLDEAVHEAKVAQELEPQTPVIDSAVAEVLYWSRRYDEALLQAKKTLKLEPNFDRAHMDLGLIYIQKARYVDAILEFQKARDLSAGSTDIVALLGYAYAVSGKRKEALSVISELKALRMERYVSPLDIALVYMGFGEKESAFYWLEKAYEDRIWILGLLKVEPIFDSLREDPRFTDLLKRVGLDT